MTPHATITRTRIFAADTHGMPAEPVAETSGRELHSAATGPLAAAFRPVDRVLSEDAVRAYLAATGVEATAHEPRRTFVNAHPVATDVPAVESAVEHAEWDAWLGEAWVAATTSGWCA